MLTLRKVIDIPGQPNSGSLDPADMMTEALHPHESLVFRHAIGTLQDSGAMSEA